MNDDERTMLIAVCIAVFLTICLSLLFAWRA